MSIFPTKILLATDGSEEGELALRTAVDLSSNTGSELHVVTVGRAEYHVGYDIPESDDYLKGAYESIKREVRQLLDEQEDPGDRGDGGEGPPQDGTARPRDR